MEFDYTEGIKMEYHSIDSRGDYRYYCPKCKEGGSYMGVINDESVPRCYKTICNKPKVHLEKVMTPIGALILSPIVSEEENKELFKNWIKETYNNQSK